MKKIKLLFITVVLALTTLFVMKSSTNVKADVNIIPSGQTLDTVIDTISISDLTFDGKTNQTVIRDNQDTDAVFDSFSDENINKNLAIKFKYDVVDNNPADSNAFRIHLDISDNKWDTENSVWVRGDGTYFRYYNNGSYAWRRTAALNLGLHEIEYGRIAILNENTGKPTGNYYVYYKVNGVKIDECISPFNVNKMDTSIFINISDGNLYNKIYDTRYVPGPYEVADYISISDLLNGMGKEITLNAHQTFSYTANAEHKSVILNCLYEVKSLNDVDCQFHFSNTWLGDKHGGIIWLRNDKNRISKAGGGYLETSPFNALGIYKLELSKLYIISGENTGKYYISLAVDGIKVLEYVIDDMPDIAGLFTTGTNCDMLYDITYMPVELNSDLYLYKWDVSKSGIKFIGRLRKNIVDAQNANNVWLVIYPIDDPSNQTKVQCKLVENGAYYEASVALTSLNLEDVTKKYMAKLYYSMPNVSGINKSYYAKQISVSFYDKLQDLSSLSENDREILESIKANILNVNIDEDSCNVVGATKSGDFSSSSITLTGQNPTYTSYVINDNIVSNNDLIRIGYRTYKVGIANNVVTLTKQSRKMMYGGSEHFVELNSGHDELMTAANLAPMTTNLGLKTIRLDIDFGDLFTVTANNDLIVNYNHVSKVQGVIDTLKNNGGITDFLAVFWVVQPYGFKNWDGAPWGGKTCPNPSTQQAEYLKWLQLNGKAAKMAAELFPDIHNFETWNEAEMMCESDGPLARPDGSNYSVNEKAKILTDLMYYYNQGIKEINPQNLLTTPSICCAQQTDNDFDVTSPNFLRAIYNNITDNIPVTGYLSNDTNPNNYFQVINIHPYIGRGTSLSNWRNFVTSFHTISEDYGDSGTEIWITEFGFPQNRESNAQTKLLQILGYANQLEFLTKFYFYKVHDYTDKIGTDRWGLYNYDSSIKAIGTAVKNYIASN